MQGCQVLASGFRFLDSGLYRLGLRFGIKD